MKSKRNHIRKLKSCKSVYAYPHTCYDKGVNISRDLNLSFRGTCWLLKKYNHLSSVANFCSFLKFENFYAGARTHREREKANNSKNNNNNNMKYVIVSGGVVSGLGKGITISSLGRLLQGCGLRVTAIKIDP